MGSIRTNWQFRLAEDMERLLIKEAAAKGMSGNEYVKDIVIKTLLNDDQQTLRSDTNVKHTIISSFTIMQIAIYLIRQQHPGLSEDEAKHIASTEIFAKARPFISEVLARLNIEA